MRSPRASGERYVAETRAFFACRAATWDAKFGDDLPAYCAAVDEAGIKPGGRVVDIGCGTARAPPPAAVPRRVGRRDLRRRPGQPPAGHRGRPAGTGPGDQARRPARALPP